MCPPGYRHNSFMATPELGHRMYGYTLWGIGGSHCRVTRVLKLQAVSDA